MMSKEAMKLALEALEFVTGHFTRTPSTLRDSEVRGEAHKAITAIREALAEQPAQQQEPLTDEQIAQSLEQYSDVIDPSHEFWKGITRAIEAAHGIKE